MAFALAVANLGLQAWRASVTYAADPRNPYVYAQTVPDTVRMAARIRELGATHPDRERMQVSVVAPPYEQWPLPWYLRAMPHVGYWTAPGDPVALQAPVIVASMEHTAELDASLGDRYVSEFFGLRPEVLLALYVERGLWERFLARTAPRASARRVRQCGASGIPALRANAGCGTVAHSDGAMTPPELALVVPCYNEAARLDPQEFLRFAATHPTVRLLMIDDGSVGRDSGRPRAHVHGGARCRWRLCASGRAAGRPRRCAPASWRGIERRAALVGFLDADLSTPLRAIDDFLTVLRGRPSLEFVLGSRVMLLGRDVRRKASPALPGARVRHGRVARARSARL